MDSTWRMILGIAMLWLHIGSAITLLGGFVFARFALAPAIDSLPEGERRSFDSSVASRFRGLAYTVIGTALISGIYNYLTKSAFPPGYHMWIGIKFLLVLHIFAAAILYSLPDVAPATRSRRATGILISGALLVLISAYLRWISVMPR